MATPYPTPDDTHLPLTAQPAYQPPPQGYAPPPQGYQGAPPPQGYQAPPPGYQPPPMQGYQPAGVRKNCSKCGDSYDKPMVIPRTSSTMFIVGVIFGCCGLICCLCCKEPVPSCPNCRAPLDGQTWFCQGGRNSQNNLQQEKPNEDNEKLLGLSTENIT